MQVVAQLLEKLQLETTLIVIFLYNKSLLEVYNMCLPNEVLDSQFYNYFYQYNLELITKLIVDLYLDQNRIYVYRAQVYLMIKKHKTRKQKQAFKVLLYKYIRYLVRYNTSNIYRIQVLQLDKVIVSKNITFNKSKYYSMILEQLEGQLVTITKKVVKIIKEDNTIQDVRSIIKHIGLISDVSISPIRAPITLILGGELLSEVLKS